MIRTLKGLYMNDIIDDDTIVHVKTNVYGRGVITVTNGEWYTDRVVEYFERDMSEYTVFTGDNSIEVFFVQEEPEDEITKEFNEMFDNPVETMSQFLGRKLLPRR